VQNKSDLKSREVEVLHLISESHSKQQFATRLSFETRIDRNHGHVILKNWMWIHGVPL
jgi:DNA-binding CsgD family transcriptional regulator